MNPAHDFKPTNILIIGDGRFGQYLAGQLERAGSDAVVVGPEHDPSVVNGYEMVVFCVPIRGFEATFNEHAPFFKSGAVVLDTCSVKAHPCRVMAEAAFTEDVTLVGCHPLFGPQSAPISCAGQRTVICPVRGEVSGVCSFWENLLGTIPIVRDAYEHDRQMSTQLLNHFIGRSSQACGVRRVELSTKTHELFMDIQDIVCGNSVELFEDMNRFNPCAREARENFLRTAMALNVRLTALEEASSIREHDVVAVGEACESEGVRLLAGQQGTVVAVYGSGVAFAVEFINGGDSSVVTLTDAQVRKVSSNGPSAT